MIPPPPPLRRPSGELFAKPRWSGGPLVCKQAKLPAFRREEDLRAFVVRYALHNLTTLKQWVCSTCGCIHWETLGPPPVPASKKKVRQPKAEPKPPKPEDPNFSVDDYWKDRGFCRPKDLK